MNKVIFGVKLTKISNCTLIKDGLKDVVPALMIFTSFGIIPEIKFFFSLLNPSVCESP